MQPVSRVRPTAARSESKREGDPGACPAGGARDDTHPVEGNALPKSVFVKFAVVALATFVGTWALVEMIRRVPPLRPLFGFRPARREPVLLEGETRVSPTILR
jgi:hypothetical protein